MPKRPAKSVPAPNRPQPRLTAAERTRAQAEHAQRIQVSVQEARAHVQRWFAELETADKAAPLRVDLTDAPMLAVDAVREEFARLLADYAGDAQPTCVRAVDVPRRIVLVLAA